jgi:hypothetical protein
MDRAPHIPAREQLQRVARVHCQRRVLWLHPLPLVRHRVLDLKSRDGLTEQQREAAQI